MFSLHFSFRMVFFLTLFLVTGKCGSVAVRLIPAPRGTGIVSSVAIKKLLSFAGVKDVYTSTRGKTKTMGNSMKVWPS